MPRAPSHLPAEPHAADGSWPLWAGGFVGAFVLVSLILALIVLPARSEGKFDPFTAICRALGIPGYEKVPPDPGAATASAPVSNVVWTVETQHRLSEASAPRGAVIATGSATVWTGSPSIQPNFQISLDSRKLRSSKSLAIFSPAIASPPLCNRSHSS